MDYVLLPERLLTRRRGAWAGFERLSIVVGPDPEAEARTAVWTHFIAACSVGKWPRSRALPRSRACTLPSAFAAEMTLRISGQYRRSCGLLGRGGVDGAQGAAARYECALPLRRRVMCTWVQYGGLCAIASGQMSFTGSATPTPLQTTMGTVFERVP